MRILIISHFFFREKPNGQSRIAHDIARSFVAEGHDVWYLAESTWQGAPRYQEIDGMKVMRYCIRRTHGLDFLTHIKHIAAAKAVLQTLTGGPPDIVHGHDLLPYVAALKMFGNYSKLCYTIHSPAVEELKIAWRNQGLLGRLKKVFGLPIIRRLEKRVLEITDIIEAKSNYTKSLISHNYGEKISHRIRIIPGWVDRSRFFPITNEARVSYRAQFGWPSHDPVFFVLRRLESRMGVDLLLGALRIVKSRGYRIFVAIGGEGSEMSKLMRMSDRLKLEDVVCFMGHISDDLLPHAYAAADASIIPTAYLECFGLIALEALACGIPVLSTPVGALPEIIGRFCPEWIATSATKEAIAGLLCDYLDGKIPAYKPEHMEIIIRDYSLEDAMAKYRGLFRND